MNRYVRKNSKAGIYLITCIPTGRVYVGQTISLDGRKLAHLHQLRKGVHRNVYLQRVFNKYGEDQLSWEFIECDTIHLNEMEQYFIDNLDPGLLMNMDKTVRKTPAGIKRSEESKTLMSSSKKGKPNPLNAGERNGSKKPEVIKHFSDLRKAVPTDLCPVIYNEYLGGLSQDKLAKKYNVHRQSIRTAIKYTETYLLN